MIDTKVLLYLLSADARKANRAEDILHRGGVVSVQVVNEFVAVSRRKLGMAMPAVREFLKVIRRICTVSSLDLATHERGLG